MNHRRSLFRIAAIATVCWVAWWVWHYTTTCSLVRMSSGHAISCRWETSEAGGVAVASRTAPALSVLWDMAARTIGIPALVVVALLAVYWLRELIRWRAR